ncbi:COMM domain-containing protein 3 isoform X1 [Palaemon carinicauda]|uniref:COMM domain-containing protein 3 isoform X1 n=1 Tax=Palaemon carinicauda TaxID=392227 RepID=UPI0035B68537
MELSIEISSSLRMLGDDSKVNKEIFEAILSETFQDLARDGDLPSTTIDGTYTDCDGGVRSRCHAALTTLYIEYVKESHSNAVFSSTLEDLNWSTDRIKRAVENLDLCRPVIRSKLASIGTYPPHIIDVDWKLDYRVRSSTGEEGGGAMYLITLYTEEADGQQGKVTFSCSLSQLTHLVTRLRQASRCIQKYASTS